MKRALKSTMPTQLVLADRLFEVRVDRYGKDGRGTLARAMGLPEQTLANYESGCSIPGHVLLGFIAQTKVNPHWLLTGEGPKYGDRPCSGEARSDPSIARTPIDLKASEN